MDTVGGSAARTLEAVDRLSVDGLRVGGDPLQAGARASAKDPAGGEQAESGGKRATGGAEAPR
jgi:hypothetical protein